MREAFFGYARSQFRRLIGPRPQVAAVRRVVAGYEHRFDTAITVLPQAPDDAPLDDFLQRVRRAHLDSPEAAAREGVAL